MSVSCSLAHLFDVSPVLSGRPREELCVVTVFLELIVNLLHQHLARVDGVFIGLFVVLPRHKRKCSVFLVVIVQSNEVFLKYRELVLAIQEYSASKKAIFPGNEEIIVAVDEGGQLGVSSGMIVNYRAVSRCLTGRAKSLLL